MHVKKLSYRLFLYTWATGQIENMHCIKNALIKLVPLKGICVNALTLTSLIYIYITHIYIYIYIYINTYIYIYNVWQPFIQF